MCTIIAHSWFQYLFHFVTLDLIESELVAMVMVLVDVMHCQMCRCITTILTACY